MLTKPSATCHDHACERRQDCRRYVEREQHTHLPRVVICETNTRPGFVPDTEAAHIRWGT